MINVLLHINTMSPFSAEVWGTVSAWVMVGVTFATGLLIYKTLRSQMIVQKLQEEASRIEKENSRIEKERVRLEFQPKFECWDIDITHNHRDGEYSSVIMVKIILKNKDCKGLKIVAENFTSTGRFLNIDPKSRDYFHVGQEFEITNYVDHSAQLYPSEGTHFQLSFEYQDLIGNRYLQRFQWAYMGDFLENHHLPPELLK